MKLPDEYTIPKEKMNTDDSQKVFVMSKICGMKCKNCNSFNLTYNTESKKLLCDNCKSECL